MMWKRLTLAHVAIVTAAAITIACAGEQALLVSPRLDGTLPLGVVDNPNGAPIHPIRRQTPLTSDESWSFDVGPAGTTVRYPTTGLTIVVPAGAVDAPTHISVTALSGAPLAYRFEPHGLQFAQPIQLTQSLHGYFLGRGVGVVPQLVAGYFADDTLATDARTGDARVIEILPVEIDVKAHSAVLYVRHFSGYTVASASADSSMSIR